MVGVMMRMSRPQMIMRTSVWAQRRPMPMWWRRPLWRMVTVPVVSMRSCRIRQGCGGGGSDGGGSGASVGGDASSPLIGGVRFTSSLSNNLVIEWNAPTPIPDRYHNNWALNAEPFPPTVGAGNVITTATAFKFVEATAGASYRARVRAVYDADTGNPQYGTWSTVVSTRVAN